MITTQDKLRCVAREVALRRNVYRKRVALGKMTAELAQRELELMQAILDDYKNWIQEETEQKETEATDEQSLDYFNKYIAGDR
jgi:hypothetical protein